MADIERYPPDRATAALESSCHALMALQLIRYQAQDDLTVRAHAERGIQELRSGIRELRILQQEELSLLALGFVTPCDGT
jgi:hypothetical protein